MSHRGKSIFVCLMLAATCVCFQAHWGEAAQLPLDKLAASQSDAARRQLKADGGYALLAAMAVACSQINAAQGFSPACLCTKNLFPPLAIPFLFFAWDGGNEIRCSPNRRKGESDLPKAFITMHPSTEIAVN